ncbi:hypothetical protein K9L67_04805 [Candidatus Woesearchaeota archaeon]|nr:hypothetical protein [Candidatus Woesearchaeota archaeon]MCF7901520.1 hypothetical protein [Candidatus Woesearchaeota archaeon]MCF8013929.1 hypothetical protein [Candidatus Woesearchaeota archaeon]
MKKNEEESIIRKTVGLAARSFKKAILGSDLSRTVEGIREEFEETIEFTKKKLDDFVENIAVRMFRYLMLVSGLVVAFLGVAYFFMDYVKLDRTMSFILVGLILMLIGFVNQKKN